MSPQPVADLPHWVGHTCTSGAPAAEPADVPVADRKESTMGFLDKLRGLIGGNKAKVKDGIDKASDTVESKVGAQHADKVENVAEKAKDAVDKLPD